MSRKRPPKVVESTLATKSGDMVVPEKSDKSVGYHKGTRPSSERTSRPSSTARAALDYYDIAMIDFKEERSTITDPSGAIYTSIGYQDDSFTSFPKVFLQGFTQFLPSGSTQGASSGDPTIAGVTAYVNNIYYRIAQKLAVEKKFIRNPQLNTNSNFIGYVTTWCQAFLGLRSLSGIVAAGACNTSIQSMANQIMQVQPRLDAALRRLERIPHPPALQSMLDRLCGTFRLSVTDAVMATYFDGNLDGTAGTMDDLTTSTGVANCLTFAELQLSNLEANATGTVAADYGAIRVLFSLMYGDPQPFTPKRINWDIDQYYMWKTQAQSVYDSTGAKAYGVPVFASSGSVKIPVLVPHGSSDPYHLSLWRPPVAGTSGLAIAATEILGVLSSPSVNQVYGVYDSDGTYTAEPNRQTSANTTFGLSNDEVFTYEWMAASNSETINNATAYVNIERQFDQYDLFYVLPANLGLSLEAIWNKIFFGIV